MNSLKGEEEVEYGYGDYVEVSKIFVLWIIFCILVIIWFLSIDLRVYVCLWINIYIYIYVMIIVYLVLKER